MHQRGTQKCIAPTPTFQFYLLMKKSCPPIFLQIQCWSSFSPKTRAQIVPKTLPHLPIEHQTTKTKSLRIGPAMATLILAQHNPITSHQYRGTSLSMKIIASSLCNFILVDCCIVASFLDLVKIPSTMAMLAMAIAILRRYYKQFN
jgi:hypothetical protein